MNLENLQYMNLENLQYMNLENLQYMNFENLLYMNLVNLQYVTVLRKNGLIAGLAKIDFFPEMASTKLRYCLSKI